MADRVARSVMGKPRRSFGLAAGLAAFAVVFAVMASGPSTPSQAARTIRAGTFSGAAAISAKVDALIGRMTVAEKFGQLESEAGSPSTTTVTSDDCCRAHGRAEVAGRGAVGSQPLART